MFAQALSRWLDRRGIHYAWVMAALAFLTMLSTSAMLGLPGAFMQPFSQAFGWNLDQISSALAVRFALYGVMGPFAAVLMERYGLRNIMCAALALVTLSLVLAVTVMSRPWHLMALWGLLLGFGTGMTAVVLGAVVATRWFDRHRGLILGVLAASTATGQLIFLPVVTWMIVRFGWRMAVLPVACCCMAVMVLVFLLARSRPQDLGLLPYGAIPRDASAQGAARAAAPLSFLTPLTVLREVAGNTTFLVLAATFFVCGLSTGGLIQTHFITLCGDYGMGAVPAASVLAMMGAFDFVGTIASGWLSDRFDNRKLLFWYYGLRGLSLFWLPHSDFTLYGLSLFAMFYGLDWIATVPPTAKLSAAEFGKEKAGVVFGWIFAAHQLGSAVAAYGAGWIRTVWLTYTPALYVSGAACIAAALVVFLIRRPGRIAPRSAPGRTQGAVHG